MRAALLGLLLACAAALAAPAPAPGVVWVVVDTLRRDALGPYGAGPEATPFLDELAARGVVFEDHVSTSSWTKTSYASLLTGQPPDVHGLYAPEAPLSQAQTTLPERLPGVDTAAFLANPLAGRRHGLTQGFGEVLEPEDPRALPSAEDLVDAALAWLGARGEAPFLLVLMPFEPHAPYAPPPVWRQRFCPQCGPDTLDAPEREYRGEGPDAEAVRRMRALYQGEVRAVDEALARLQAGLEGLGLDRRTTWVLTADHGEALGEHRVFGHAFHLWDEVLRVPLIMAGPGLPRGERARAGTSHLDLAPTLLRLLGRPIPSELPGESLLNEALSIEITENRTRLSEVSLYGIHRVSARQGGRKLTAQAPLDEEVFLRYYEDLGRYPSVSQGPRWALYDLEADPEERRDLGEAAARRDPLAEAVEARLLAPGARDPR
ncbi:MAG: sulfatase [Alphaproteobacteria bacterium]|nr:sulfatase [Alphaproteobacteria bacterium]